MSDEFSLSPVPFESEDHALLDVLTHIAQIYQDVYVAAIQYSREVRHCLFVMVLLVRQQTLISMSLENSRQLAL